MSWSEVLWWLPSATVAAVTALAVLAVAAQPWRPARKYWLMLIVVVGALAFAGGVWRQRESHRELVGEAERLHSLLLRLDQVGSLLPGGPRPSPGETFDTVEAAIRSLNARIEDLQGQVIALREQTRTRRIDQETAAKLVEYLRQAGGQRVVVSCVPDDVEAFTYANQIANLLREAGWEALGPEKTTIFGEAPAMGVRLFVRSGVVAPDAARILLDALTRFNIPFQSGIAPSDAIPDPATTELFVSHKP